MRVVTLILFVLLILLQFKLWFGEGGFTEVARLEARVADQRQLNDDLLQRNAELQAEVEDLRERLDAVEALVSDYELRSRIRELLRGIGDFERLAAKLGAAAAGPRDVVRLADALEKAFGFDGGGIREVEGNCAMVGLMQTLRKQAEEREENEEEEDV